MTEIPPFFRVCTVTQAFGGVLKRKAVIRRLKAIGAIEKREDSNVNLVNSARVHEHWPSVYHRCVSIWMSEQGKDGGE